MIYFQPWIIEVTPTDEGQVKIDVCSRNICRIRAHPSQAAAMPFKESMLKFPSISRSQLSFRWLAAARDQKQLTEGTGICEECSDQVVIVKKLELTYPDFFLIIFSFLLHFNSFGGKVAGATTPSSKAWCPDHFFQQSEGHRLQTQRGVD